MCEEYDGIFPQETPTCRFNNLCRRIFYSLACRVRCSGREIHCQKKTQQKKSGDKMNTSHWRALLAQQQQLLLRLKTKVAARCFNLFKRWKLPGYFKISDSFFLCVCECVCVCVCVRAFMYRRVVRFLPSFDHHFFYSRKTGCSIWSLHLHQMRKKAQWIHFLMYRVLKFHSRHRFIANFSLSAPLFVLRYGFDSFIGLLSPSVIKFELNLNWYSNPQELVHWLRNTCRKMFSFGLIALWLCCECNGPTGFLCFRLSLWRCVES